MHRRSVAPAPIRTADIPSRAVTPRRAAIQLRRALIPRLAVATQLPHALTPHPVIVRAAAVVTVVVAEPATVVAVAEATAAAAARTAIADFLAHNVLKQRESLRSCGLFSFECALSPPASHAATPSRFSG